MTKISPDTQLKFASQAKAIKALEHIVNIKKLRPGRIHFKDQKPVFNANGHPYLTAHKTINFNDNECIEGEIDLITGDGDANETNCWVN